VRQAAQHAIDTTALVKTVFRGEGEPANQFIYKGHWGYNPAVVGYPYNPAKARQLLKQAGFPDGFKTKIIYRSNPQEDQLFAAVQGFLKAVGIDAELDPAQKARYDQLATQGGKWEGLIMNRVSPNPDVTGVIAAIYAGGGLSYAEMLVPDDYAKAIQNAVTAPDFVGKQKWTREIMKSMTDKNALQITLLYRWDFVVSQKFVYGHGFNMTPANAMWTPADTWLDK
jgi:ABC-type transport system substrate-binding protein